MDRPLTPLGIFYRQWRDDHEAFCRESLSIRDKRGDLVPFELQPAQKKLHAAIATQRAAGVPIRIIFLKPRRVMVSAATAAEFFHIVPFTAGQHALVVAHDKKAAKEIWNYHRDFHNTYKPFKGVGELPRLVRKPGVGAHIEYENGSYITIETANNLTAGRAFSIRFLHFSEYAYYRDARKLTGGLLQCVPNDPDTMVVKESSANGVGNAFHQDCLRAMDPSNGGGYLFVFFAWWEHPEYRTPFRSLDAKAEFQATLSRDEWDLLRRFTLSLEQMAWRRSAIKDQCAGSVETFHQEYPTTPEEAFLYSGRPRFDHKQLTKMPVILDAPTGELVEHAGPQTRLTFEPREKGPLQIFKRPQANRRYVAGADVAEGIDVGDGTIGGRDPDWSVFCVLDRDTGEQVAVLRGRIEPDPFGEYAAALARWYNFAFIVPEKNGVGIAFIEALLRHGYPPGLIYHSEPEPDKPNTRGTSLQQLGWRETEVSRVQLVSKMDAALREMSIILHCPTTVSECFTFIVRASGRAEHQDQCHDDCVFATALAVEGLLHPPADDRLSGLNTNVGRSPVLAGVTRYGSGRQESMARRGRLLRT